MRFASTVRTLFLVTGLVLAGPLCGSSVSSAHAAPAPASTAHGSGEAGQVRPTPPASVRVTVVDQTGAVIVGASVVISADGASTTSTEVRAATTDDTGSATLGALTPGTYSVRASFPGFDSRVVTGVRLRAGENRQSVTLPIKMVEAEVTVERDRQGAAADPRATGVGTALTTDDIEALSDDPDTLQQQLAELAGPGAVVRVDGFQGSGLPPKAQIQSVRIARDQFSAEHHDAGGVSIEIITKPGLGPIRFRLNTLARQGRWGGRSPFVEVKGPERNINVGMGLGGTLVQGRSSFSLNVSGNTGFDTPNLFTAVPGGGRVSRALPLRASRANTFVNGQVDFALSAAHILRLAVTRNQGRSDNAGVGGYNEPERAFSTTYANTAIRLQHSGPVSSRAFARSRVQFGWSGNNAAAETEAVTVRVLDAFTRGGAQRAGGDRNRNVDLESDVDYVLGRHALRVGATLVAGRYASDATANYLGEYTFESLDAYLAGSPRLFTQRVGDPSIAYTMVRAAAYVQDDVRVRRGVTVSAGLRYEWQSHAGDLADLGPRTGVSWAPFASGRTTLRGSAGLFYDWLPASTYDQVQRIDGFHQRELSIADPGVPAIPGTGVIPPINRYLLLDRYTLPRIARVSAGLDQRLVSNTRIGATYSYQRGSRAARGLNLNAPVAGVRPDSGFANVIEVVSDAGVRQHELEIDASLHPGALVPVPAGPRISLRRTTLFVNYTLASQRNNTDGPFAPPASGSLDAEWGPARGADVRHRLNLSLNNQVLRNLMMSLTLNASSAPTYSVLSGRDDNGDGIFNDRPAGVGRNSERASAQAVLNANISYAFVFGPPAAPPAGRPGAAANASPGRYRLQFFIQALNLTNRRNYVGFSGVATSPFFGQPTGVGAMRRIDLGTTLNF